MKKASCPLRRTAIWNFDSGAMLSKYAWPVRRTDKAGDRHRKPVASPSYLSN